MKTLVSSAIRRWRRRNRRRRSTPNSGVPSERVGKNSSCPTDLELPPCAKLASGAPALSFRGPPPGLYRLLVDRAPAELPAELRFDSSKKPSLAPCFTFYQKVKAVALTFCRPRPGPCPTSLP